MTVAVQTDAEGYLANKDDWSEALANELAQELGVDIDVFTIDLHRCVAGCEPHVAARRGAEFGVVLDGPVGISMERVNARMKAISGHSNENVTRWLEGMDNVTLYRAHARFASPDTVEVNDDLLRAERIFVNVGARAFVPD